MKSYLEKLNAEQLKAVTSNEKYIRVIAGAGSGKTRVLTTRIAYLVDELGYLEKRILAFTFTNKAAKEMKDRITNQLNLKSFNSNISTFHSYCARFLREEISRINYTSNFIILDEEDQKEVIKEVKRDIDEDKILKINDIINYISDNKNKYITPTQALSLSQSTTYDKLATIYQRYEEYNKNHNYLDFDDLLIKTVYILKTFPFIREKHINLYDYILVDEYQDTDNIQYELIKLLVGPNTNLFVVGDPDQTIYTWRGANMDIIMNYTNDFKGSVDYILSNNYRSQKAILDAANALINNNHYRIKKELTPIKEKLDKPLLFAANSAETEAEWIIKQITSFKDKYDYKYEDFAILYRSNYYSINIEKALIKNSIPYDIYGSVKFYERKEIKDALCYLRLIINSNDDLAFNRIINTPKRKIGKKSVELININAKNNEISCFDYIINNLDELNNKNINDFIDLINNYKEKIKPENYPNFNDILRDLMIDSGYKDTLNPIDDEDRIENLTELGNILFSYQVENPSITLNSIIEDLTLYSSADAIKDKNCVKLMTIHTAKGLEFKNVFVAGLAQYVFPTARALNSLYREKAIEEERRLCYVAFTRAMDHLFISYNDGFSYAISNNLSESIFIKETKMYLEKVEIPYYKSKFDSKNEIDYSIKQTETKKPIEKQIKNVFTSNTDYRPGNLVNHIVFGEGVVIEVDEKSVKVAFKDNKIGVKVISKLFNGLTKKE